MVAIKNLFYFTVAVSAAVLPRNAAGTQTDLNTINSDTTALTKQVNAYDGTFFGGYNVNTAVNQLDSDIKTATTNANNGGAFTDAQAQSLIAYITNNLEPNIANSLQALKNKKSTFDSAGTTSTAKSSLNTLKTDTDSLGAALLAQTPSSQKTAANNIQAKIDADFDSAIQYFS